MDGSPPRTHSQRGDGSLAEIYHDGEQAQGSMFGASWDAATFAIGRDVLSSRCGAGFGAAAVLRRLLVIAKMQKQTHFEASPNRFMGSADGDLDRRKCKNKPIRIDRLLRP